MNVLAIETSSSLLSVAAKRKDGVSAEINLEGGLHHAENLTRLVKEVLEILKLRKEDLDLVACGLGPGSFTGLRIGCSAAKGLAVGLKKKVLGISSLDLTAEGIPCLFEKLAVVVDARREKIYAAFYERQDGAWRKIVKDSLFSIDQLLERLDCGTALAGNALLTYGEKVRNAMGRPAVLIDGSFWNPRASLVFSWMEREKKPLRFLKLSDVKPLYLRLSEAEERLGKGV